MVEDRPRKIALIGATAYELEHRLVNPSQRCIHRYTNPPEDVAAGYVEGDDPRTLPTIVRRRTEAHRLE